MSSFVEVPIEVQISYVENEHCVRPAHSRFRQKDIEAAILATLRAHATLQVTHLWLERVAAAARKLDAMTDPVDADCAALKLELRRALNSLSK